jgi:hypothetical protein
LSAKKEACRRNGTIQLQREKEKRRIRKMAEIKVIVNGEEYTEDQFKRDIARMFDAYLKNSDRNDVFCWHCPLHDKLCNTPCNVTKVKYFDLIKFVYEWAKEHPVLTNGDMLKKTFGDDWFRHIGTRFSQDWLDKEYKEPKEE